MAEDTSTNVIASEERAKQSAQSKTLPLIPKFRFKEFDGEWIKTTLGKVFTFKNGLNSDKNKYGSGIKFINVLDIINDQVITYDSIIGKVEVTAQELKKNEVIYGDILFQRSSETREEVGQANVYTDKNNSAVFGGFVIRGRKKIDYNPYFINYLLKTSPSRKEITTKSGGSTRYNVGQESLSQVFVTFPSLPEQQKIASFLITVDEKIQQLTQKKSLLEQYKKGVMQQLFSGKLRFKDENGEDFPDWEEKRLGDLTYKVGKKYKENIQYPIYSINNQEGFRPQSEQFDGLDSNDRGYDISLYKIVESETFAYNPARINVGSIGYSYDLKKVIVSSLYVCFKTTEELEDLFLLVYLDTYNFHKDILRYEEGGVRQYLFYENFSHIKVPLPSIKEQQKIADYLSAIDTKIETVNQQIEKTQSFKKGLLQQMFV
jgi:type I restriction enzyme S subunit|tara:strand:- start:11330 stop:12625 length:1296 start_codon:yes stop_codon:yes gene_type:complete